MKKCFKIFKNFVLIFILLPFKISLKIVQTDEMDLFLFLGKIQNFNRTLVTECAIKTSQISKIKNTRLVKFYLFM